MYRLGKNEFTEIGGNPVFSTGNTIVVAIDGVEVEYEYVGDAARSVMAKEHQIPIFGYARENVL